MAPIKVPLDNALVRLSDLLMEVNQGEQKDNIAVNVFI